MSKQVIINTAPMRRITPTSSSGIAARKEIKTSSFYTVYGIEATVTGVHGEDHSVDVTLESGVVVPRVKVMSKSPIGENDTRGFGERNLPMIGSRVYVSFPNGPDRPDRGVVTAAFFQRSELLRETLLVDGEEHITRKITEDGLDISHNRDTGLIVIEDPEGLNLTIDRANQTISLTHWNGDTYNLNETDVALTIRGDTYNLSNSEVALSIKGNTININNLRVQINSLEVLK